MNDAERLIAILKDTRAWASDLSNIDLERMYSGWSSQEKLIADIDAHILSAEKGKVHLRKILMLFAPTAGLCEILSSDQSVDAYEQLAARFDDWYARNGEKADPEK